MKLVKDIDNNSDIKKVSDKEASLSDTFLISELLSISFTNFIVSFIHINPYF